LFLKAAFRYASQNRLEHIFIHGHAERQHFLFELLTDFGFADTGGWRGDRVFVKEHPSSAPTSTLAPFEYFRTYYPHYKAGPDVQKFIVPIRPEYHRILFPDYESPADRQLSLFRPSNAAGNAIKLAYLCRAQVRRMDPGDILLFYRSGDERATTSVGVVERYETLQDADEIARRVSRRTVYTMEEISAMSNKPTKVMLFRLVRHFEKPLGHAWLNRNAVVAGNIQSIRRIKHEAYERLVRELS
jgi:hypothetical protein